MNIKEERTLDVVRGKLAKVYLVKYDRVWVVDAIETGSNGKYRDNTDNDPMQLGISPER